MLRGDGARDLPVPHRGGHHRLLVRRSPEVLVPSGQQEGHLPTGGEEPKGHQPLGVEQPELCEAESVHIPVETPCVQARHEDLGDDESGIRGRFLDREAVRGRRGTGRSLGGPIGRGGGVVVTAGEKRGGLETRCVDFRLDLLADVVGPVLDL